MTTAQANALKSYYTQQQAAAAAAKAKATTTTQTPVKEPTKAPKKTPEKEDDVDIEKELNALIRSGAAKSEVNNYLRQALNSGVITQSQYNTYKNTYAPRGNTY